MTKENVSLLFVNETLYIDTEVFTIPKEKRDDVLTLVNAFINGNITKKECIEEINNIIIEFDNRRLVENYNSDYLNQVNYIKNADYKDIVVKNNRVYHKFYKEELPIEMVRLISRPNITKSEFKAIMKFYIFLMNNPDKHVYKDIFKWFSSSKFAITSNGNIIAYRRVVPVSVVALEEFVQIEYLKAIRLGEEPCDLDVIYKDGRYQLVSISDSHLYDNVVGNLADLFNLEERYSLYTDAHTGKMNIRMMEEVSMPRQDCDNDPNSTCSTGLHLMSKNYGLEFGKTIIVALVNPMDIVAVPNESNYSKFRACAYLPLGLAETDENGLIEFDEGVYDMRKLEDYLVEKSNRNLKENWEVLQERYNNKFDLEDVKRKLNKRIITKKY